MDLKKAVDLQVQYYGKTGTIHVDANGYVSLNDLQAYFPYKKIDEWQSNKATKELVAAVEGSLNTGKSGELKPAFTTRRGRFGGGTFAHEILAMDFAAWLSVEFRIHIYTSYINGTQHKQDWNIKRILAANNYKILCEAVKNAHEEPKHYHFSNEARMLNTIVFGEHEKDCRETASEAQLDAIAWLEGTDETLINLGMSYEDRKSKLSQLYAEKYLPNHREILEVVA